MPCWAKAMWGMRLRVAPIEREGYRFDAVPFFFGAVWEWITAFSSSRGCVGLRENVRRRVSTNYFEFRVGGRALPARRMPRPGKTFRRTGRGRPESRLAYPKFAIVVRNRPLALYRGPRYRRAAQRQRVLPYNVRHDSILQQTSPHREPGGAKRPGTCGRYAHQGTARIRLRRRHSHACSH